MQRVRTREASKSSPRSSTIKWWRPSRCLTTRTTKQFVTVAEIFPIKTPHFKVDVREIGTIVRSLGHCPSESQLQEVIGEMEDTEQMGYIHLDRFLPVISRYRGHRTISD